MSNPESEPTEVGEQTLITGVKPVSLGAKLTAMTAHPIRPKRNPNISQKPCDLGLFDEAGLAHTPGSTGGSCKGETHS